MINNKKLCNNVNKIILRIIIIFTKSVYRKENILEGIKSNDGLPKNLKYNKEL